MKIPSSFKVAALAGFAVFLSLTANAQVVIFSENFDSGTLSTGAALNAYRFGDTTTYLTSLFPGIGVGGTGGWATTNIAANGTQGFSGVGAQYQKGNVSGNTSVNLSDYTLSFDVRADAGSLNIQVQTWTGPGFGGTMTGTLSTAPPAGFGADLPLSSTFTHYSLNLGDTTIWHTNSGIIMSGGTVQLTFQLDNGGPTPYLHFMDIDNLSLTMNTVPEPSALALCGLGFTGLVVLQRRRR